MPAAAAVAVVAASAYSANRQAKAAQRAADAQSAAAGAGIDEQRRQFDAIQELLKPYIETGTTALGGQSDLIGLNGQNAQQQAIQAIESSPMFASLSRQGEDAILQNASATGGLRGGNTQRALAEFQPALLNSLIDQQYGRLGGLAQMGQNSAVMQGNFGQQSSNNVTNLLQQAGAAQAGGYLAQGRAQAGLANQITQGIGAYYGYGGKF